MHIQKKILLITGNFIPLVTEARKFYHRAQVGAVEATTFSNTKLQLKRLLTLEDIESLGSRPIDEYDKIVIYVAMNEPRLPVVKSVFDSIRTERLLLVFSSEIDPRIQAQVVELLGHGPKGAEAHRVGGVETVTVPVGDVNGVGAMFDIRMRLLYGEDTANLATQAP